jgi:hypothetical protein
LTAEYGKGWSEKQLRHCLRFSEVFPDEQIVSTLWRQFSWSHLKEIIYIDDPLKRSFYLEICRIEKWNVRVFHERIQSMLYERTAISRKPEQTIRKEIEQLGEGGQIGPDLVFRDPYFLDFLNRGTVIRRRTWSPRSLPSFSGSSSNSARTLPSSPVRNESPSITGTTPWICYSITAA